MPFFLSNNTGSNPNGKKGSKLRRFLGIGKSSRPTGPQPASGPAPTPILAGPAPAPTSIPVSVPAPGLAVVSAPSPTVIQNPAFGIAVKGHMDALSPMERDAFNKGAQITPEELMEKIRGFDELHCQESQFRRCTSGVENFLKILDQYLKPLAICIGHSPEFSSLIVGGLKLIVDIGLRFVSFFSKLTEMMERLTGHLGYLTEYAQNFIDSPKVQNALCDVYGDLLQFFKGARNVFTDETGSQRRWTSFRIFLRVMWEPFETEFDAINVRFDDRVRIVIRTAGVVEHTRLRSKELLKAQQKDVNERQSLLEWLSGLAGLLNFDKDHDRIFKKRYGATGNWLVESPEFKDWDRAQESCLLWCYGNPGVGKTVLTSLVVETISNKYALNDRTGIAFVYFNYQDQTLQKPTKILAALIKQLCRKKKDIPDHLKQFYRSYSREAEIPSYEKLQSQLVELSGTSFDQVFFVIDAMDECENRKQFLPFVTTLARESSCILKVFVTSRREKDILTTFTRGTAGFPTIQVEATKVDADIAAFVHFEIGRRTGDDNFCVIDQELQDKIEKTLVSQSNGMFLWVKYQLDYVYELPSTQDIEEALESLPQDSDMSDTYLRILTKIDKRPQAVKTLAKRALLWVITAGEPLSLEELAIAVAIEPTSKCFEQLKRFDGQTIIDACGNLLTVESGVVRPVHYTVQEFLITPESVNGIGNPTLLQRYQVFLEEAHVDLAHNCIRFMLFPQLEEPSYAMQYKLSFYVVYFWNYHILAPAVIPEGLRDIFNHFISREKSNLRSIYIIRYEDLGDRTINPLSFCLAFDLLPVYQAFHGFDMALVNSPVYKESLHFAAQGGSVRAIQTLLDLGFAVDSQDTNETQPLYWAVHSNHKLATELLLRNGADVNAQGGEYGNILQAAALRANETVVQTLLEKGADVNAQGGIYGNALQAASYGDNENIVQMLLDKRADVNAQGGYYGNALQAAALKGKPKLLQLLMDSGADINAQGEDCVAALRAAALACKKSMLELFLKKEVDINAQGDYARALRAAAEGRGVSVRIILSKGEIADPPGGFHGNALQAAAYRCDEIALQLLLDNGANTKAEGGYFGYALQAAIAGGDEKVVRILLDNGADVNAQGGYYGDALKAAVLLRKATLVELFLNIGADINAESGEYGYALQAAAHRDNIILVETLLNGGADINAQGGCYGTALHAAAYCGNEAMVMMFLEKGADINAQGGDYGYALQAAAYRKNERVVEVLLNCGADINAQGGFYGTALHAAAFRGNKKMVMMFLKKGADINAQGGYHGNALQAAALGGHEAVVEVLLENGADIDAQGGKHGSALQAAIDYSHSQVAELLSRTGRRGNTE